MSILIKDMEMPTSCGFCFALDDYGDYPVCQITKEQRGYNFPVAIKRMDNCPLVPVPPHGRLIDADAFMKKNEYFADRAFNNPRYDTTLRELVGIAPTIIPAEKEGET